MIDHRYVYEQAAHSQKEANKKITIKAEIKRRLEASNV